MHRFPVAVVVDARPRHYRPAVVQLPVKRTHAVRAVSSVRFHPVAHAASLHHQPDIHKILKITWCVVVPLHVFFDGVVAGGAFLVGKHGRAFEAPFFGRCKAADGFHLGERLESEFTHKAGNPFVENFKRLASVPHAPVMGIAQFQTFGAAPVGCVGRGVNVIFRGVKFFHFFGQ